MLADNSRCIIRTMALVTLTYSHVAQTRTKENFQCNRSCGTKANRHFGHSFVGAPLRSRDEVFGKTYDGFLLSNLAN